MNRKHQIEGFSNVKYCIYFILEAQIWNPYPSPTNHAPASQKEVFNPLRLSSSLPFRQFKFDFCSWISNDSLSWLCSLHCNRSIILKINHQTNTSNQLPASKQDIDQVNPCLFSPCKKRTRQYNKIKQTQIMIWKNSVCGLIDDYKIFAWNI